jgi:hypothetical protein
MRPADAEGSTRACPHGPPAWWADHDLLYETVATLEAPLPSPQPASTGCQLDGRAPEIRNVIARLPEHARLAVGTITRATFTTGLNRILLGAAVIALVSGVVSLAAIRGRDFALQQRPARRADH